MGYARGVVTDAVLDGHRVARGGRAQRARRGGTGAPPRHGRGRRTALATRWRQQPPRFVVFRRDDGGTEPCSKLLGRHR